MDAESLLTTAETALQNAWIGVNAFAVWMRHDAVSRQQRQREPSRGPFQRRTLSVKDAAIEKLTIEKLKTIGVDLDDAWMHDEAREAVYSSEARLSLEIEAIRKLEQEQFYPSSLFSKTALLNADAFAAALELVRKSMYQLSLVVGADAAGQAAVGAIDAGLPGLKAVRDSAAHADERARHLVRGKALPTPGIATEFISAPPGSSVVVGSMLVGNVLHRTGPDGHLHKLSISQESLDLVTQAVQVCIDMLKWDGSSRKSTYYDFDYPEEPAE